MLLNVLAYIYIYVCIYVFIHTYIRKKLKVDSNKPGGLQPNIVVDIFSHLKSISSSMN